MRSGLCRGDKCDRAAATSTGRAPERGGAGLLPGIARPIAARSGLNGGTAPEAATVNAALLSRVTTAIVKLTGEVDSGNTTGSGWEQPLHGNPRAGAAESIGENRQGTYKDDKSFPAQRVILLPLVVRLQVP